MNIYKLEDMEAKIGKHYKDKNGILFYVLNYDVNTATFRIKRVDNGSIFIIPREIFKDFYVLYEGINHPPHYGGRDNPYEAIKVIEAWGLNFNTGNAIKYICRAGKKGDLIGDLKKAEWYISREIENLQKQITPDWDEKK